MAPLRVVPRKEAIRKALEQLRMRSFEVSVPKKAMPMEWRMVLH
jgi:hypothetical protein